jgi:hypothetical protein
MRGVRRAASVTEQQDFMPFPKGSDDELGHLHDAVRVVADELLFHGRAVVEGVEDKVAHRRQF